MAGERGKRRYIIGKFLISVIAGEDANEEEILEQVESLLDSACRHIEKKNAGVKLECSEPS